MSEDLEKNITPEAIEESKSERVQKGGSQTPFNEKTYLNVKLDSNEDSKDIKIRLLTIDKDSNLPFKHIFMHSVKVPTEIAASGFKSYVCLEKTEGKFSETLGHECPFCKRRREAYKKYDELKKQALDEQDPKKQHELFDLANAAKKESISYIPNEVGIIRCIERGHEEDGPKFWKFNLRSDKKDPENQIRTLYQNRIDECTEEKRPLDNILDINTGRDLKLHIEAVKDKEGKRTNKTSITVMTFGDPKPVTTDNEKKAEWLNDEKVWSDAFVAKPYDYLNVILQGKIPWYDKANHKWVEKIDFKKQEAKKEEETPEDVNLDF